MPKRRILEKIKLDEISGVDRPCQPHALVTIIKRREQEPTMNSFAQLEDRALVLKDRVDVLTKNMAERPEPAAPIPDFDEVVAAIQQRDSCAGTVAFTKARKEHPDIYNRLNAKKPPEGPHDDDFDDLCDAMKPSKEKYYGARSNADRTQKSANATADFMREVDAVMIQKRLSRTAAMTEARKRFPEKFAAYQEV